MLIGGLDVGTTGCKISLFTEEGELKATAYREYPSAPTPRSGREFAPDDIWKAVKAVIREVTARVASPAAIGVTSFGESFACLDEEDRVLFPALLYTDPRGEEECGMLTEHLAEESLTRAVGTCPHSMYSLPKMMYLKRRDPERFRRVRRILLMQDFLVYRLCGVAQIDYSLAARTMAFDVKEKTWYQPALSAAGIDPACLSRPVPAGALAGTVRPELAEELGLAPDTRIVTGAQDQVAAALGAGTFTPGDAVDGCGTVECITPVFDAVPYHPELYRQGFPVVPYALRDTYVTYALSYTGGASLKWFRDRLAKEEKRLADEQGKSVYALLDAAIPPHPTGLLIMPHFAGAATPYMDAHSKAAILGLTLETTSSDLYRALMEGSAYEMLLSMERLEEMGIRVNRLIATGGGAASPAWLQIKADVWNCPVCVLEGSEAGAAGTCMLAGVASGIYPDLPTAAKSFVRIGKSYTPNPENARYYRSMYERYRQVYPAIRPLTP